MSISAAQVKELREKTGAGILACRKALEETSGDLEAAIDVLRKSGEAKAGKKADRSTGEGVVAVADRAIATLLCETDFVARNEQFQAFAQQIADTLASDGSEAATSLFEGQKTDKIQAIGENINLGELQVLEGGDTLGSYVHSNNKLGAVVALEGGSAEQAKDVAMHAVAMNPLVANAEDVPEEVIAKEKEIWTEQLKSEGKPEEIIEKILQGKVQKFCAEQALSSQPFVKNPDQTVGEYLGDAKLVGFVRLAV